MRKATVPRTSSNQVNFRDAPFVVSANNNNEGRKLLIGNADIAATNRIHKSLRPSQLGVFTHAFYKGPTKKQKNAPLNKSYQKNEQKKYVQKVKVTNSKTIMRCTVLP